MKDGIIREITDILLDSELLRNAGKSKEEIEAFADNNVLAVQIEEMAETIDYSCKSTIYLCSHIFEFAGATDVPDNMLEYAYQYALSLSFPNAVTIPLEEKYEDIGKLYLSVLKIINEYQKISEDGTFQSHYPFYYLTEDEVKGLERPKEYKRFKQHFESEHVYEMMKLNLEVTGRGAIDHITGVHYLALHLGRQLKTAGVKVDLGRISGAAAGHDIGKFGCKPSEMHKIAYYHYYYTNLWFKEREIEYIGNTAVNHSTWDLELENLSIESLVLIYADFCVKRVRDKNYPFNVKFLDLEEAFQIILDKLDNVDSAKERRYKRVYRKLKDFRDYLIYIGIELDIEAPMIDGNYEFFREQGFSLMDEAEIVEHYKFQAVEHNINLMHMLRNEISLNNILEHARGEKDTKKFRRYIYAIEEYFAYLTPKQKRITLDFLYESLLHWEEDIRKQCAEIMGKLIASYDDSYKKELPPEVNDTDREYSQIDILKKYLNMFIYPDIKITEQKRKWIYYSFTALIKSLIRNCALDFKNEFIELFEAYFSQKYENAEVVMLFIDIAEMMIKENCKGALWYVCNHGNSPNSEIRLKALYCIDSVVEELKDKNEILEKITLALYGEDEYSYHSSIPEDFVRIRLAGKLKGFGMAPLLTGALISPFAIAPSTIYLDNLKAATAEIVKIIQIEILEMNVLKGSADTFYTALHFCNLLKVSRFELVRNAAGEALLNIYKCLSEEQRNDIAIELIRALEIEGFEYAKFVPKYLGALLRGLPEKEFLEIYIDLRDRVKKGSFQTGALVLKTIGAALVELMSEYDEAWSKDYEVRFEKMVGLLLNGLVKQKDLTNQTAFEILGRDIIGNGSLSHEQRAKVFKRICKKMMVIINESSSTELDFLSYSSGLNYVYRFISDYEFFVGRFEFVEQTEVAVYLGTFDPFSIGQKEVVKQVAASGMEVLVVIDEFQWRRRTQPNLVRRRIVNQTISNLTNVYQFPRGISFNLLNEEDVSQLECMLLNRQVFIIVGEDAFINMPVYENMNSKIYGLNHIIMKRSDAVNEENRNLVEDRISNIQGEVQFREIGVEYEHISCSQIRKNIDRGWDISDLVDPLALRTIYEKGLYRNEPQFKEIIQCKFIEQQMYSSIDEGLHNELVAAFNLYDFNSEGRQAFIIRDVKNEGRIIGATVYRFVGNMNFFNEIENFEVIKELKEKDIDKIVVIEFIGGRRNDEIESNLQVLLTETLARVISEKITYAIYKNSFKPQTAKRVEIALFRQGFVEKKCDYKEEVFLVVNMESPCALILDGTARMKSVYRNNKEVRKAIHKARFKLQKSLLNLYPGNLVLSFDRGMMYEHIIRKIVATNEVSKFKKSDEGVGELLCVPYGDIFKRWSLPNTITKAFHTERYYSQDVMDYEIKSYPNYLSIGEQSRIIKAFNRPVILIDDLLDRGHRVKFIEESFVENDVSVAKIIVAIMTERAKVKFESKGLNVESAYYIPEIKVWFNESDLYPFIGGDAVWKGEVSDEKLLPSVNLILPYVYPRYIKGVNHQVLYELSKVCIENAISILKVVEAEYLRINQRGLTLAHLGEVMITPRYPDVGQYVELDYTRKPTEFLENELSRLDKLKRLVGK